MSKKSSEAQKDWHKVFKLAVEVSKEKRAKNKNLTHQVAMKRAWDDPRVKTAKKKYEDKQKKKLDAKKTKTTSTRKKVVKKKVVKKVRRVKSPSSVSKSKKTTKKT